MLDSLCLACNALTTLLCLLALGYLCIIPVHNCFPCSVSAQSKPCCTGALSFHVRTACVCMATLNLIQLPNSRLPAIKVYLFMAYA